ncbi:Ferri-bacillibactin esterase BesA [Legionella massiliensis]|uniref:Ferri-bacillibactin esterase BesA n=1 Tax=Legionella massiliensis TaxID=1034943 RepID=A0A078L2Y3_9GAMM|nr:alpha/beta hydrolase-fold protein [Legionella massiliensis]CDZ78459.1 Ferri-bacillibactin esterase BesA [Legionella massiliensis]CEE14197.1 Ferri-bacillibactin esterase BesA [Legionella massiliensis]
MRKFKVFIIISLFVIHSSCLFALNKQGNSLKNFKLSHTHIDSLISHSNGVNYNLYIHLPPNYESNNKHYSVIYLLDADYSFLLAKQIIGHLSERKRLDEYIIVGIAYPDFEYKKNRTRDYTPSHVKNGGYGPEYQQYSGGASKFYQFIHRELMPYMASHYQTNKNSTFVGHSFGGLFGIYLLLNHPETFNNYIVVSPSLWYDNHLLLKAAKNKQTFSVKKPIQLMIFIGENENKGDYRMVDDVKDLNVIINQKSHPNLRSTLNIIPQMDHDTVFPSALTLGLMSNRS